MTCKIPEFTGSKEFTEFAFATVRSHHCKKHVYNRSSSKVITQTRKKRKSIPSQGPCLSRVFALSSHLCGSSLGTLVSSHNPKMCTLGSLACLNSPSMNECTCVCVCPEMGWYLVQGWFLPCALSCQDKLWPPVTLNRNKQVGK